MSGKRRMSASVDADLIEAGRAAVAGGRAESFSSWVNAALRRQADHDRRLLALDEFLARYEAEHGEITDADIEDATRWARNQTIVVPANGQDVA